MLLFLYTMIIKHFGQAIMFALILALNYTILTISGNIFLSDSFKGQDTCEINFDSQRLLSDSFSKDNIISSGTLIVAQKYISPYIVLNKENPLAFIRVDFREAKESEYPIIFEHLNEFVVKQDVPVIIFGEFGVPAWNVAFRKFLDKSGLLIKNRLLFTESSSFNIFTIPSFYILGFKEMGIKDIDVSEKDNRKTIKAVLSFNLAQP